MRKILTSLLCVILMALSLTQLASATKDDGYDAVVKLVETHYKVKRKNVPLLARAAIKGGRAVARIASSSIPELAEAGSIHLAVFEDQDFSHPTESISFMAALRATLSTEWSPLVETLAPQDDEQSYIYMRGEGDRFKLLVVNIGRRDAAVLEIKLSPETLIKLVHDPEVMGKDLTDSASGNSP